MKFRLFAMMVFGMHTVCANANQAWLNQMIESKDIAKEVRQETIKNKTGFFSQHGFVLFYASTCPHCHHFAPTLKAWADRNGAETLALSFDNQPLPDFPHFLPATTEWVNAAFAGQAISYPALFVVNPKTQVLYPVGFGSMSDDELGARMAILIPKISSYESRGAAS